MRFFGLNGSWLERFIHRWRHWPRWLRKLCVLLVGGAVLAAGLAMTVLPGPAVVVIPMGLLLLATEFFWARRWIVKVRRRFPVVGRVFPHHRTNHLQTRVERGPEGANSEGPRPEEK